MLFQTKPQIAQAMLEEVWAEGIPSQWVVGDRLYGNSPGLRNAIHQQGRWYGLAMGAHHPVMPVEQGQEKPLNSLVEGLAESNWERLCFRMGEKGLIWYQWTVLRVMLSNDEVGEQWLVLQRTLDAERDCKILCTSMKSTAATAVGMVS